MDANISQQAMELVKAQASIKPMTPAEMIAMRDELIISLSGGTLVEEGVAETGPVCDPKSAIKESSITCLICGKRFKVITAKHLATHDLTPEEYKAKFGYKKTQALACKGLARERKKAMQGMRLWERRKKNTTETTPAETKSKPKKSPEASAS